MGRIHGIDLARGIAVLGMFALHAIPAYSVDPLGGTLLSLFGDQRAQILFAVLDGLALGILSGEAGVNPGSKRKTIAIRGLFLLALGLLLSTLGSGIVVILDYYGVYFFLILPIIYLRARWLAAISALLLVLGPLVVSLARDQFGDPTSFAILPPLSDRLISWLLVGQYPAVQFLGYVLAGLVLFRIGIVAPRRWLWALIAGIAAGLLGGGVGALAGATLIGTTATLISSLGWVVGVIVLCLAALREGPGRSRFLSIALRPIVALGSMPVTMYALHVLYFAAVAFRVSVAGVQSMETWLVITAGGLVLSLAWYVTLGRGPLERIVRVLLPAESDPAVRQDRKPVSQANPTSEDS